MSCVAARTRPHASGVYSSPIALLKTCSVSILEARGAILDTSGSQRNLYGDDFYRNQTAYGAFRADQRKVNENKRVAR